MDMVVSVIEAVVAAAALSMVYSVLSGLFTL